MLLLYNLFTLLIIIIAIPRFLFLFLTWRTTACQLTCIWHTIYTFNCESKWIKDWKLDDVWNECVRKMERTREKKKSEKFMTNFFKWIFDDPLKLFDVGVSDSIIYGVNLCSRGCVPRKRACSKENSLSNKLINFSSLVVIFVSLFPLFIMILIIHFHLPWVHLINLWNECVHRKSEMRRFLFLKNEKKVGNKLLKIIPQKRNKNRRCASKQ